MQLQELNTTGAEVFEGEVQAAIESGEESCSLLLIDVGDIGKLVARSGHSAAIKFMRNLATNFQELCRDKDRLLKIGDHTFGLIIIGIDSPVHLQLASEKILRMHEKAIRQSDTPYQAMTRIGIASYPKSAVTAAQLIQYARIALESARKDCVSYFIYAANSVQTMSLKWNLQEDVGRAIEDKELQLHFQPKVSAATGAVVGAEALLRWQSDRHGMVPPDVFIPVANDIGMMNELTRFIITTALQQAAEWPGRDVPYSVSINLEADSVQNPDIHDIVSSSISIFGADHCHLILEITERALLTQSRSNFGNLKKLRALGVGISIDDFGTGYSSLSYFKNIPATELKIDKSFVTNLLSSNQDRYLVEAIIWLAHRFGLEVVAEGVESRQQLELLTKMGCNLIQGYTISRPLPQNAFCDWLAEQPLK